jgi:hypothetical protein
VACGLPLSTPKDPWIRPLRRQEGLQDSWLRGAKIDPLKGCRPLIANLPSRYLTLARSGGFISPASMRVAATRW